MLSPNLSAAPSFDEDSNVTPLTDTAPALVGSFVLTPAIFASKETVDDVLEQIRVEAERFKETRDISTPAGRAAIASFAYKIARSKTALDELGKGVVSEWKTKANAVDEERRRIRYDLDALRDDVRAPLDAWEHKDQLRRAEHEERLRDIDRLAIFSGQFVNSAIVRDRLVELAKIGGENFEEFAERATRSIAAADRILRARLVLEEREEAERVEAERLELERLQREQQEREERIARAAREEAERKQRQAEELQAAAEAAQREIAERIERDRVTAHEEALSFMRAIGLADPARSSESLLERSATLDDRFESRDWQEFADAARNVYTDAHSSLTTKIAHARVREEQDRKDREAAIATRARLEEQQRQEAVAAVEEEARAKRETSKRIRNRVRRQIAEAIVRLCELNIDRAATTDGLGDLLADALIEGGKIPHVTVTF
jgi:colicin import membrane protein